MFPGTDPLKFFRKGAWLGSRDPLNFWALTLYPATGVKYPQCSFSQKSPSKHWNKTVTFCDIVIDPFGFPKQLSVSLYLFAVLRGRSGSNVHETGFATTNNNERMESNDINFRDVMFLEY